MVEVSTYYIQNFGCRATQADGAALESSLEGKGLAPAPRDRAELVILNTCTVTSSADDDVRQAVRRVRRENPNARILVTGCYAQRAPEEIAAWPGVTWVVGNSHKTQIPEMIADPAPYHGQIRVSDIFEQQEFLAAVVEDAAGDRTRPNLKIQDGCNNRCSFCIIPFVRGRSRSAQPDWVVGQVRGLARRYREVVLSGINLGRWGRELGGQRLAELVRLILNETEIERLRLSRWSRWTGRTTCSASWPRSLASRSMYTRPCRRARTAFCAACIAATARATTRIVFGRLAS